MRTYSYFLSLLLLISSYGSAGESFSVNTKKPQSDSPGNHWVVVRNTPADDHIIMDDYQYSDGVDAKAMAVRMDQTGVYVAGWAKDIHGVLHFLIRKSRDDGNSWYTMQDCEGDPNFKGPLTELQMQFTSSGDVYVFTKSGTSFIIRKNRDGNKCWISPQDMPVSIMNSQPDHSAQKLD